MELILLRHGKSPSLVEAGVRRDEDRPLAELGRQQAKDAGRALAAMDCAPVRILASPLLRARQTAERALKGLDADIPLELFEPLASGADPEELAAAVAPRRERCLLLVGHQPDLGALASRLVFGSDSGAFSIKPGGMLLLETDDALSRGRSTLKWLLQPSQIERLS